MQPAGRPTDFDTLLQDIRSGKEADQATLLGVLCRESKEERSHINARIAEAFAQAGKHRQAQVFIERAWLLSGFSSELIGLYKEICKNTGDIASLREAYKRLGMRFAREGKISQALETFDLWQYAYAEHYHIDKYAYDMDILESIQDLAQPYRLDAEPSKGRTGNKLRLAYLVFGADHANSVLVKHNRMLAEHHNKDLFEIAFFIPPSNISRQQAREYKDIFESHGTSLFVAQRRHIIDHRLVAFAKKIRDFHPDILITSAALAKFEHYFISLLRPAPLVIGLLQGPPQQFVAQGLDFAISWSHHPLIDSPIDTSFVKLGAEILDPTSIPRLARESLDIPDDAVVLMSAGRHMKFQHAEFWQNLLRIMETHHDVFFVAVGAERHQVACLVDLDTQRVIDRTRFLGWRKDCVSLMSVADILLDTYPSGGGHVLIDAMALGVPFVSFSNNYLHAFDQTDWSVAEEFVDIPELIVPRGDFHAFYEVIDKLISNKSYRKKMSNLCASRIRKDMPSPEAGVAALEREYLRLAKEHIKTSPYQSVKEKKQKNIKNLVNRILTRRSV